MFGGIKRDATDALFSDLVRAKASWRCERCHKDYSERRQGLHCSHFFGRGNKAVRWEPENASALCFYCHKVLGENPNDHRDFFIKRLGEERYNALVLKAKLPRKEKVDVKMLRLWLKQEIKKVGQVKSDN